MHVEVIHMHLSMHNPGQVSEQVRRFLRNEGVLEQAKKGRAVALGAGRESG